MLSILLVVFSTHIFAQNKHSELYNQVKTISKTMLQSEIDSFDFEKYRTIRFSYHSLFNLDTLPPVLLINNKFYENYAILDSISIDSISSIEILKSNNKWIYTMFGSRAKKGMIILQTVDEYENKWYPKKKKRKSKTN
ncbi:MAG TPA: hypothetical protein PKI86_10290 [Chitinophagales bacterium]|jgi:hypothetical protein|nr:hypothetical protein [Chitinophagales bacterium]